MQPELAELSYLKCSPAQDSDSVTSEVVPTAEVQLGSVEGIPATAQAVQVGHLWQAASSLTWHGEVCSVWQCLPSVYWVWEGDSCRNLLAVLRLPQGLCHTPLHWLCQ